MLKTVKQILLLSLLSLIIVLHNIPPALFSEIPYSKECEITPFGNRANKEEIM